MCERPVSVAFIVARNRVRAVVLAGLKSEVFIIGVSGTALMSGFLSPKEPLTTS